MDSLLFSVNAILPIILTVLLGYCLKRIGMLSPAFVKMGNTLVFRVLLPAMLFLNVYKMKAFSGIDPAYLLYAAVFTLTVFAIGIPAVMLITKEAPRRGPLLQGTFRSNYALVGIPLATSLFGESGAIAASLLSAIVVPLYNILGVISLSLFREDQKKPSLRSIVKDVVKNPLIISIAVGLLTLLVRSLFLSLNIGFRLSDIRPLFTLLDYLSRSATPMALLLLGAQFEFSSVTGYRKELIFTTLTRAVAVPLLGIGIALLLFGERFGGAEFASLVAVFATPVAVSSVAMTQEMDSDVILAGQIVIFTTLTSAVTVFITTLILKMLGIF